MKYRRDPRPQSDHPPPFTVPDRDRKQSEMTQYQWLNAQFVDVSGSAEPGSYTGEIGEQNAVAAVCITNQFDGNGVIVQGRPENLVAFARELLRTAELVQVQTMQNPALRRMYGLTSVEGS